MPAYSIDKKNPWRILTTRAKLRQGTGYGERRVKCPRMRRNICIYITNVASALNCIEATDRASRIPRWPSDNVRLRGGLSSCRRESVPLPLGGAYGGDVTNAFAPAADRPPHAAQPHLHLQNNDGCHCDISYEIQRGDTMDLQIRAPRPEDGVRLMEGHNAP